MKTVSPPRTASSVLTYNEAHEFTRRIPTYITEKQRQRDAKIVSQIVRAGDSDPYEALKIFIDKSRLLSNTAYWEVLRTLWVMVGSVASVPMFKEYFRSKRGARSWFMTVEDAAYLDGLEFPIMLYRAYAGDPDEGISWTSDKEWCQQYASHRNMKIKQQLFNRSDIYAYISRRGESEFLII